MSNKFSLLRPYQIRDVKKLNKLNSAGCFNEQRTGKTPTSLAWCHVKNIDKLLIVCPGSAMYPWADEIKFWTDRDVIVCAARTRDKRIKLVNQWTDTLIISYDALKQTSKAEGLIKEILKQKPKGIIIDEAHRIKGRTTSIANAIFKFRNCEHKLALTATPAPNKPYEIWAILNFLYPKYFTSYWNYIDEYYIQTQCRNYTTGKSYTDILGLKDNKVLEHQQLLNKISTNTKRKEAMPWLPKKNYIDINLPPTKAQLKYCTELETFFETEDVMTLGVLDTLTRIRQVLIAPALLDFKGGSPKLDWIIQYVKDYPEKSIIIFSRFTSFLKIIHSKIKGTECIIGGMTPEDKHTIKNRFQTGKTKILLINIDVGKEALTLDKGEVIIFVEKFPPVNDLQQAEDRFVATTKERANKEHTIINLKMEGTYDAELYDLCERNISATDILNNYKHYLERRYIK